MRRAIFLLITCFSFCAIFTFGQSKSGKKEKDFAETNLNFSFGGVLQSRVWGEIGINYGTIHQFVHGPIGNTLLGRLSAEFTLVNSRLLIAPKIGIQKSIGRTGYALLDLRTSVVRYERSGISEFRLNPEIVVDMQRISYAFGLNLPFTTTKLDFIPKTKFSILLNF